MLDTLTGRQALRLFSPGVDDYAEDRPDASITLADLLVVRQHVERLLLEVDSDRRVAALAVVAHGERQTDVARLLEVDQSTISRWIAEVEAHLEAGL